MPELGFGYGVPAVSQPHTQDGGASSLSGRRCELAS